MKKHKAFWWLLLILIIATFLRTYQLDRLPPGLYPDEAMYGNNAVEVAKTGNYKVYYPENNGREGLFINIQAQFLRATGVNESWVLRLVSAIFGILAVWGIYLMGKELFSRRVGLLSAFFLAVSFWHINFSRIGFRAIMAPTLAVLGLYFLFRALRSNDENNNKRKWAGAVVAILGGLVYGLGFHTYIAYRVTPILLILPIIFLRKKPGFWRVFSAFLLGAFLAGLPIGLYYIQNPGDFFGRTSQISVFSSEHPWLDLAENTGRTMLMFFYNGDHNWRHNFAGRAELFWPVALLFLLGIGAGIKMLAGRKERLVETGQTNSGAESREQEGDVRLASCFVLTWFVIGFLPVVISNEGIPHALRALMLIPPAMVLAGIGAVRLYDFAARRINLWVIRGATALFLGLLFLEGFQTYFLLWGTNPNIQGAFAQNYADIAREINTTSRLKDKYVVVEAGGVDVRGVPMPAESVMFLTDTFLPEDQAAKKVHYILPADADKIPPGAMVFYIR